MMKRAALYIRVSTDEQARHGLSLGEQRQDLTEYARQHGYLVYDVYADEGVTARKAISKRLELQRLLDDVRAGAVDIIIFKCLDRWFRNIKDFYNVQSVLDQYGVLWECSQEDYNTTTTNGRLLLNLKLTIAQNECDQTSDRIKYINDGKRRRGEVVNMTHPFGYRIVDKHFVVQEDEAEIVRFAFDCILSGSSMRQVPRLIFERYGRALSIDVTRRWFRNEVYTGRRYDKDDFCQPIISREIFQRVQELLGHRRRAAKGNYLFTGKLLCPGCGRVMVCHMQTMTAWKRSGRTDYKFPFYFCRDHAANKALPGHCDYGGGVLEHVVERWLVENIVPLLEDYRAELERHAPDVPKLTRRIAEQEAKLDRLNDLYADGLINRAELHERRAKVVALINQAQNELKAVRTISQAASNIISADNFAADYARLTVAKRKALWQKIIKEIKIGRGKGYRRGQRDISVVFF